MGPSGSGSVFGQVLQVVPIPTHQGFFFSAAPSFDLALKSNGILDPLEFRAPNQGDGAYFKGEGLGINPRIMISKAGFWVLTPM